MAKYLPRAGSKTAFIAQHLDKPASEIVRAASKAGIEIDLKFVHVQRSMLKAAGITKPLSGAPPNGKAPRKRAPSNGKAPRKRAPSSVPRRARPRVAAELEAPASRPIESPKLALLRRVIFDVGYDAARVVFDEFARMHAQARAYERSNV